MPSVRKCQSNFIPLVPSPEPWGLYEWDINKDLKKKKKKKKVHMTHYKDSPLQFISV